MRRRDEDDVLNSSREFFRLFRDYQDGVLTKTGMRIYRARVISVDPVGGQIEQNPPNPPNSVQARIFSSGLDMNIPTVALTIFYPMFPAHLSAPLAPGEHIYVTFEDAQMSQGLWISSIPSRHNLNNADPDQGTVTESNASTTFEGDAQASSRSAPPGEYASLTTNLGGRPEMADDFEQADSDNVWRGKRVIHIGDSMATPNSPMPRQLGQILAGFDASFYQAFGRTGWGVNNWITGRGPDFSAPRPAGASRRPQTTLPTVDELVRSNRADVVLITLGGNDASNGEYQRSPSEYRSKVSSLWNQVKSLGLDFAIWNGPPTVQDTARVGDISGFRERRDRISEVIREVVRPANFIDSRQLTSRQDMQVGRNRDGIHWRANAPIGRPWAQLFIDKVKRR